MVDLREFDSLLGHLLDKHPVIRIIVVICSVIALLYVHFSMQEKPLIMKKALKQIRAERRKAAGREGGAIHGKSIHHR